MELHHRRSKVCYTRPAYRDGRKEKAVKVYTINDESNYVLVQGVPALKLTKELLDLCSLYGAIQEYRLLEDFPEKEEFTQVYWIQYQQIQAARVAKRKLDDHPFYGGILHVCYAPEYETVDDTRKKLQGRRKAVAKRVRILEAEHKESSDTKESSEPSSSKDTSVNVDHTTGVEPRASSTSSASNTQPESTLVDTRPPPHSQQHPPKLFPETHWTDDDMLGYPRLPTAHATLPVDFNPYPDGVVPPHNIPRKSQQKLHLSPIGPSLPTSEYTSSQAQETKSTPEQDGNSDSFRRFGRKRQSSEIYQKPAVCEPGRPVKKRRALDRCSVPKTQALQTGYSSSANSLGGARLLPRNVQRGLAQGNVGHASSDVKEHIDTPPDTGDVSLDSTVQDIRNRMRAVTESSAVHEAPSAPPQPVAVEPPSQNEVQPARPAAVQQRSGLQRKTRRKI